MTRAATARNESAIRGPFFEFDADEPLRRKLLNVCANVSLLEHAQPSSVEQLLGHSHFRKIKAGDVFIREGSLNTDIYCLLQGVVRIFHREGTVEATAKLVRAPIAFGELSGLSGVPGRVAFVEALEALIVAVIPLEEFTSLLHEDHAFSFAFARQAVRQHALTARAQRNAIFGGPGLLLANVLLSYAEAFPNPVDPDVIEYELSYADLARQIGCSRRTAIRTVQDFVKQGLIAQTSEGIRIDRARLQQQLAPRTPSLLTTG